MLNDQDNCPYYSNAAQTDVDGNDVGDDCETDSDGDGTIDKNDTCPHNPAINTTSLSDFFIVELDPSSTSTAPYWEVKGNGAEVTQSLNTWKPEMLIGK